MRRGKTQPVVRRHQSISRVDDLVKVCLDLKRREASVCRRKQARGNIDIGSRAALRAPNEIGQKQSINEKLRVIFRSNAGAGLEFEDVEAIALTEHRIDASL